MGLSPSASPVDTKFCTVPVAERDAQAAAYEAMPIPERRTVPSDQPTPAVACVQMDGGRLQWMDRAEPQRNEDDTFWREMKVGCLWSMASEVSAEDPCLQLPASFVDPERMRRMVREIKGFSGPEGSAEDEAEEPRIDERPGRPEPLAGGGKGGDKGKVTKGGQRGHSTFSLGVGVDHADEDSLPAPIALPWHVAMTRFHKAYHARYTSATPPILIRFAAG